MDLYPSFRETLESLLKSRPRRVLAAVSGGPDSMALMDLATRWAAQTGARVRVGHVDHGLRGRASAQDAAFVRRQARSRGLPFDGVKAPVKTFAGRESRGLEEAGRILRYGALARLARRSRSAAVLTAHTLGDQAETVVMSLVRGAGAGGLGGMAPDSPWPVPGGGSLRLLRPLLARDRTAIAAYLKARRIPFRTDPTNALPMFFRNRVRPALQAWEKERPGLAERLGRLAEILRDEEDFWDDLLDGTLRSRRRSVDLALFKRYHKALQRRLLRRAFALASFSAVERARLFALDSGPATRQSIPGGWVEKKGGRLVYRPLKKGKP